jgi:hypothetical protein
VRRRHEQLTQEVDDRDALAVPALGDREAPPGRVLREVRGADHPVSLGEVARDLGSAERVVAERDDVCTRLENRLGQARRDPETVRGIFAVDDAEVDS